MNANAFVFIMCDIEDKEIANFKNNSEDFVCAPSRFLFLLFSEERREETRNATLSFRA